MNLFKFMALIAVPFTVMTAPLAAQAEDTGAEKPVQKEKTILAGKDKDDGKKDEEKDGKKDDKSS